MIGWLKRWWLNRRMKRRWTKAMDRANKGMTLATQQVRLVASAWKAHEKKEPQA